jgi:hypothetical protein
MSKRAALFWDTFTDSPIDSCNRGERRFCRENIYSCMYYIEDLYDQYPPPEKTQPIQELEVLSGV